MKQASTSDLVVRGCALVLATLVALALTSAACGPPPLLGVGRATEAASPPATKPGPDAGALVSPIAPDYTARLAKLQPDSFVAAGHAGGRYAATVYVSSEAKDLVSGSKPFPVGTEIVMATQLPSSTHAAGPTFFMLKEPGTWRFGVVESPNARPDETVLCTRCHAEAPHDEVFALPE